MLNQDTTNTNQISNSSENIRTAISNSIQRSLQRFFKPETTESPNIAQLVVENVPSNPNLEQKQKRDPRRGLLMPKFYQPHWGKNIGHPIHAQEYGGTI